MDRRTGPEGFNVERALRQARATLAAAGDDEAEAAAERLLMHLLGVERARLLTHRERPLSLDEQRLFAAVIARRATGEPVPYITGRQAFRTLDLEVNRDVLIPRPESELLVDVAIERRSGLAVEVGTGSGAIALAIATESPRLRVVATERSGPALQVARRNRDRLGLEVALIQTDLIAGIISPIDVLVANLPYIDRVGLAKLPTGVREWEPQAALDGGPGGLVLIGALLVSARRVLAPGGLVVLEIAFDQGAPAAALARRAFPAARVDVLRDLAAHDRVVRISLK